MLSELEEFYSEFFQRVHNAADADGRFAEDAFFDLFCENLVDAGELDTADRAHFEALRGVRVDGYGGDPMESEGTLSLIIADFHQSPELETLTASDMNAIFKRVHQFLARSLDAAFRNSLEETSPAFGLADLIRTRWTTVTKVRLFLISNRMLSARIDGRPAGELEHATVTYSVWDIQRLHRYERSGRGREPIDIDLDEFGGPLPGLPAHLDGAGYEAYLVVVPGKQLAAIYDRWGARLLEQNVRCFLQARGSVNKGIRNTIEGNPEMFFAYNNGITATAESVGCVTADGQMSLTHLRNLQIVNGGQTTASIHAASRKKDVDLSRVFVQMKLSIIPPEQAINVVPKISEFANSQNRVNAADFFANHPFHIRVEEFSRRIFAPSPDGTFRESKWFYERARGQYQDARAYLTTSARRKFELEYPKHQLFSKTDLAKFLNVWRGQPHVVSQGAQKNFTQFAESVGAEWSKQPDSFNEVYYREAIAKAIIFREAEQLVTQQPWYQGGYRAQVVAHAIAKLAHEVTRLGRSVNFEPIWKTQSVSPALREALGVTATAAHAVIVTPPPGISNVTEWAKKQGCWQRVMDMRVELPRTLVSELLDGDVKRQNSKAAVRDQKILNTLGAQVDVVNLGGNFWRSIQEWGMDRKLLSPADTMALEIAASIPRKIPNEKQSLRALEVLERLREEGCEVGLEKV